MLVTYTTADRREVEAQVRHMYRVLIEKLLTRDFSYFNNLVIFEKFVFEL